MAKKTTSQSAANTKAVPTTKASKAQTVAPAKKVASVAKKTATAAKATKSTTATKPKAVKKNEPSSVIAIRVLIDVGFGNHLHIRGEGANLSWDHGQPMACLGSSEWQWTSNDAIRPVAFKVLINDHVWSVGNDYIAVPGEITVIEPAF